ncbi:TolB family protein [Paenibacillus sp. NPDC057967]|uniref:TolB family protein n=1 Tax=Paenibacillus sp. NPDC057967 TaxID=3346293 RepID=UPI0036DE21E1
MNKTKAAIIACVPALLLAVTACSGDNGGNREVIREPGKTITVIDNDSKTPAAGPAITVGGIKRYEKVEIFGWLDKDTVIVSQENESLAKMKLEELADSYPRSLYRVNLKTGERVPLKEQENVFLGGASLSPDNKHLIYQEYTLGDPVYHVMNLDTLKSFSLTGEPIGGAMSARWTDDGSVIGASYGGGAYTATTKGDITALEELGEGALIIVAKLGSRVYYNSNADEALKVLHLDTKETQSMGLGSVGSVIPSPDGKQLLVTQYEGSKVKLTLCDLDGGNAKTIAEGAELGGMSWSADQRLIAFSMQAEVSGATVKGLYVHDLLSDQAVRIAADVDSAVNSSWSPAGDKLTYSVWNGSSYDSSVVEIHSSLQP